MAERWITCPKCKGLEVMLSDTGKFIPCQVCHGIGIVQVEVTEVKNDIDLFHAQLLTSKTL